MQVLTTFPDLASQTQTVRLGDVDYRLTLDWRERLGAWYATLATVAGVGVVMGVRLEPGADLLRLSDPAVAPPGQLLVVDAAGVGAAAVRSTVGLRFSGAGAATLRAGSTFSDGTTTWVLLQTVVKGAGTGAVGTASPDAPGATEAAAGTINTFVSPGAPVGVTVTNPGPALPGSERVPMLQADLGVGLLLMYVAADELPPAEPLTWSPSTAFGFSAAVEPTNPTGWRYRCTVAGTSGGTEPVWPRSLGATVADGSCTWEAAKLSDDPLSIV